MEAQPDEAVVNLGVRWESTDDAGVRATFDALAAPPSAPINPDRAAELPAGQRHDLRRVGDRVNK